MFKDSVEIFQKVGEIVVAQISEEWTEANIEAEIDNDLADLCVWYFDSKGEEKYFDVTRELTDCFVSLRKITGDPKKGLWSKCLFTINSEGKFKTDFSYDPPRWEK